LRALPGSSVQGCCSSGKTGMMQKLSSCRHGRET
jgi:hypothetical protein